MRPFLTEAERIKRAEKLENPVGYRDAMGMYVEYNRTYAVMEDIYNNTLHNWAESGRHGERPQAPEYKAHELVKAAYPVAYAYIRMQQGYRKAKDDEIKQAIYRYAMDRVLWGDDPATVTHEAELAAAELEAYRDFHVSPYDCADGIIRYPYSDAPKWSSDRSDFDAYCQELAMYFMARVMGKETA